MSSHWSTCESCQLYKSCSKPRFPVYGNKDASVLIVGECPNSLDEVKSIPLSSESGQLLKDAMTAVGFDLKDCAICYTVRCRPSGSVPPTKEQCELCSINTYSDILEMPNLRLVLLLGSAALHTFTKKTGILKAHGTSVFVDGVKYFPIIHPSAVIRDPSKHDKFVHGIYTFRRIYESDVAVRDNDVQYVLVDSLQKFDSMYEELMHTENICVDIETTGLKPFVHSAKVVGVGLGYKTRQAFFVPIDHSSMVFSAEEQKYVVEKLKVLMSDPSKKKFGHNFKFDTMYLEACWNFETAGFSYDTMLGEYALDENKRNYALKPMALEYTDMGDYESELDNYLVGMNLTKSDMYLVPLDLLLRYCCCDVDATVRIRELQEPKIKSDPQVAWVFDNLLIPGAEFSKDLEKAGIGVDLEYLAELEKSIPLEMAELDKKMRAFPEVELLEQEMLLERLQNKPKAKLEPLNFGSAAQLGRLLFKKFELPVIMVSKKTGLPSTNKSVVESLAKMHEFPKLLQAWKLLNSAYTKYVCRIRSEWVQEKTGRVHGNYMLHGTRTGRYASSHPNMQQIPRDTRIKNIFVPKAGHVYVHLDYSQVELRVLAIFSEDAMMMNAFKNGEDIHTATAAIVAGIPVAELQAKVDAGDPVAKDKRRVAKTINFGLLYGMGSYKLSGMLGISEDEAELFISNYFAKLPGVKRFVDRTHRLVKKQLYVTSLFGRKRRLPYANSRDVKSVSKAERQSVNSIIQSTAADMTLSSLIQINRYFRENKLCARIVMTVHDSIVIECPMSETSEVAEAAKHIMENLDFPWISVPIVADMEVGDKLGHLVMTQDSVFSAVAEEAEDEDVRERYSEGSDKGDAVYVVGNRS